MKGLLKKSSILIISAIMAFAGCTDTSDVYTIIGGSNSETMGTVTGDGNFHEGDVATLVAEPKPGYHFAFWADGKRKNPRKITVSKNMVLMAIFGIGERPNNGGDDEEDIVNPDSLAISLSGTISESITLEDRGLDVDYIVYDRLTIGSNATVNIEPGVKIRFESLMGNITVADNATLNIAGTGSKPVVFIGKTDDADTGWHGIELNTTSTSSTWEHATLKNGNSGCLVSVRKGTLSMKSCIIDNCEGNGLDVWEEGRVAKIEDCIFKNCKQSPILFENNLNINALGDKNDFFDNDENYIWCRSKNFGDGEYVFRKMTVPYLFTEGIEAGGKAKITIEPGVKIRMGLETKVVIGKDVLFKAVGTASEPISFQGDEDLAGYWDVFKIETADNNSIMEHCFITGAGLEPPYGQDCALFIGESCAITMKNCSFTKVGSDFGATVYSAENFAKNFKFEKVTFKDADYKDASDVYVVVGYGVVEGGSIFDNLEYLADMLK
ncbi:MAG: hypothetical protein J6W13_09815 [Salinivirgaceae bacterium]|nr:hypothetical protein [Salinivirgaceae bacterium]